MSKLEIEASTPNVAITIAKDLTIEGNQTLPTLTGNGSEPVLTITGGNVTVRGLSINGNGQPAIERLNGNLTVYANNFTNTGGAGLTVYTRGGSGVMAGSTNAAHNWWGTYTTQPSGVGAADWQNRLGAPITAWGQGALGDANISGGSGTGVIVSHGRGTSNAPFEQAISPAGDTQCSPYYDFFVTTGSSGNWQVTIPIDADAACDNVFNNSQLFIFDFSSTGCLSSGTANPACWNLLTAPETIVQGGRTLQWTTASSEQLGGTPLVAANPAGEDPTAIGLLRFESAQPIATVAMRPLTLVLLLAALAAYKLHRKFLDESRPLH